MALVSLIFVASGSFKLFAGNAEMASGLGGASNVVILGLLELVSVALFLYPKTGVVGALLLIAYMGGAIATHLTTGQDMLPVIAIQIVIWVTSVLCYPELGQRLFNSPKTA